MRPIIDIPAAGVLFFRIVQVNYFTPFFASRLFRYGNRKALRLSKRVYEGGAMVDFQTIIQ